MFNPLRIIFAIDRLLLRLESFFLVTILGVMLGFTSLQVILRNFFDTGVQWGDVFNRHLVLWIGFFGATISTKENKHIRIDALTKIFSVKLQPLVEMVVNIFCLIVGALLAHAAYRFMQDERAAGEILFLSVPTWYVIVIMPVGFGIITFRCFVQLLEVLLKFGGRKIPAIGECHSPELELSVKIKLS